MAAAVATSPRSPIGHVYNSPQSNSVPDSIINHTSERRSPNPAERYSSFISPTKAATPRLVEATANAVASFTLNRSTGPPISPLRLSPPNPAPRTSTGTPIIRVQPPPPPPGSGLLSIPTPTLFRQIGSSSAPAEPSISSASPTGSKNDVFYNDPAVSSPQSPARTETPPSPVIPDTVSPASLLHASGSAHISQLQNDQLASRVTPSRSPGASARSERFVMNWDLFDSVDDEDGPPDNAASPGAAIVDLVETFSSVLTIDHEPPQTGLAVPHHNNNLSRSTASISPARERNGSRALSLSANRLPQVNYQYRPSRNYELYDRRQASFNIHTSDNFKFKVHKQVLQRASMFLADEITARSVRARALEVGDTWQAWHDLLPYLYRRVPEEEHAHVKYGKDPNDFENLIAVYAAVDKHGLWALGSTRNLSGIVKRQAKRLAREKNDRLLALFLYDTTRTLRLQITYLKVAAELAVEYEAKWRFRLPQGVYQDLVRDGREDPPEAEDANQVELIGHHQTESPEQHGAGEFRRHEREHAEHNRYMAVQDGVMPAPPATPPARGSTSASGQTAPESPYLQLNAVHA